jgi:hypothetical protein
MMVRSTIPGPCGLSEELFEAFGEDGFACEKPAWKADRRVDNVYLTLIAIL